MKKKNYEKFLNEKNGKVAWKYGMEKWHLCMRDEMLMP